MIDGDVLYAKIGPKLTHPFQNADFQLIFARSASAVTLIEKSSIISNRKSTYYALSNEPKANSVRYTPKAPEGGGAQKRKITYFSCKPQMVDGRCPLLREIFPVKELPQNCDFQSIFPRIALQP